VIWESSRKQRKETIKSTMPARNSTIHLRKEKKNAIPSPLASFTKSLFAPSFLRQWRLTFWNYCFVNPVGLWRFKWQWSTSMTPRIWCTRSTKSVERRTFFPDVLLNRASMDECCWESPETEIADMGLQQTCGLLFELKLKKLRRNNLQGGLNYS